MPLVRAPRLPPRTTAIVVVLTLALLVLVSRHQWLTYQEHRRALPDHAHLEAERRRAVLVVVACALGLPVLLAIWVGVLGRTATSLLRQRRAEHALRETEQRYRALFESNPLAALVYDPETQAILGANGAAVEQFGYTRREFQEMTLRDLRAPTDLRALQEQAAALGTPAGLDPPISLLLTRDGAVREVELTSRAVEFGGRRVRLATIHDVTDRRRLEEEFRHAQKMDALGRMAGAVAHDFNNVLNVILGFADLTMRTMDDDDHRRRNLAEIRRAGDHAASLTRQLLALGRGQVLERCLLDLNAVVEEMGPMVRRLVGDGVEVVTSLAPGLGCVRADPGQIGQVLLNLAGNARDAMPAGGTLTIETAEVDLDGRAVPALRPGRYVMLAVSDTGCGIPRDVQQHLFEPFFTTKGKDKGTGLGLAIVYGIVKQSDGAITVDSEIGAGSTFRIYLPRVEASANARTVCRHEALGNP